MSAQAQFEGQTAIVTGGARGIGRGIAAQLARLGAQTVVWDNRLDRWEDASDGVARADAFQVDVTDLAAVERAFSATADRYGPVSILINNAGVNGPVHPVDGYPVGAWHTVIAADLTSVFYCCRTSIPRMIAARYGRIVNISSISGKDGNPNVAAYSAAKAGVIGFSKSLAKEVADTGITVNCVAPGIAKTDLLAEMTPSHIEAVRSKIPMNRFCRVEEIAAMVAFVASPACSFTTGAVFDLSGGRATY
ncbi:MAG: SDR family oxidoreductase [Hyphomicrobiales bacterium]